MQDEVNQDYSEQIEVDGMKKGADIVCLCIIVDNFAEKSCVCKPVCVL